MKELTPLEKLIVLCSYLDMEVGTEEISNSSFSVSIRHYKGSYDNVKVAVAPSINEAAQTILDDMKDTIETVFK